MRRLFIFVSLALLISLTALLGGQSEIKFNWDTYRISNRDILGAKENFLSGANGYHNSNEDTIRILAIRVEFQKDEIASTTGDGRFDLSNPTETTIDPPPHNRTYFQHQLLALGNYFRSVSKGRVILGSNVFPTGETDSYVLPHEMKYYSADGKEELKDQRWSELLADAITAADTSDDIDFSKYDSYFVFHAGVGSDFSFDFDPTPFDIQSVFLDSATVVQRLGQSIPVNGVSYYINEGLILPETQSQEGIEMGLLGTMTVLFASQLGMPSLFNTETLKPGIGRWGLLDQGSANFQGLIPAEPCAWMKVFMGWEVPEIITRDTTVVVGSSKTKSAAHIYKIPIDSQEYFLIENRQQDPKKDGRAIAYDADGTRIEFKIDMQTGEYRIVAEKVIGVITQIDEYDFDLPGSGILIWHIDERVIAENLASNSINADREHRGVDLEECDGAQDIGYDYDFLSAAYGTETGDYWDAYWSGNKSHWYVNETDSIVSFSPTSIPNSNANSGAITYITISEFSDTDTLMTFTVKKGLQQDGFPVLANANFGRNEMVAGDVDGDGQIELFASSVTGQIFAWRSNGTGLIENGERMLWVSANGDSSTHSLGLFASVEDSILTSPALGDLDGDGDLELIVVSAKGLVIAYHHLDSDGDGESDRLYEWQLGQRVQADPMVISTGTDLQGVQIIVGTESGSVLALGWDGSQPVLVWMNDEIGYPIHYLSFGDFESADAVILVTTEQGKVYRFSSTGSLLADEAVFDDQDVAVPMSFASWTVPSAGQAFLQHGCCLISQSQSSVWGIDLGAVADGTEPSVRIGALQGSPAVGDVDGDGYSDCVFVADGQLFAQRIGGAILTGFPISLSDDNNSWIQASPAIGDIDQDGEMEIVISEKSRLNAFKMDGSVVDGFPLPMGDGVHGTPILNDFDDDGDIDIAALGKDGWLYIWDLEADFESSNIQWGQHRHDFQHTACFTDVKQPSVSEPQLMPQKSVYCYPNPTEGNKTYIRYHLTKFVENVSIRIFDLAGDFITELQGPTTAGADNEVVWDLNDVQSGVYLARVKAQSGGEAAVEFVKIAVVK